MNFGQALEAIKAGHHVARAGWNGKGMRLGIVLPADSRYQRYIEMRTVQGTFVPWLASQTDMLAVDWGIIDSTGMLIAEVADPGLSFGDALKLLKEGKRIARPSWAECNAFLGLKGIVISFYSSGNDHDGRELIFKQQFTPSLADLEATDWQEVK